MAQSYTTMVGTVGTGIWTSNDAGERWTRCRGMWNETQVFALTPIRRTLRWFLLALTTASTAATMVVSPSSPLPHPQRQGHLVRGV